MLMPMLLCQGDVRMPWQATAAAACTVLHTPLPKDVHASMHFYTVLYVMGTEQKHCLLLCCYADPR